MTFHTCVNPRLRNMAFPVIAETDCLRGRVVKGYGGYRWSIAPFESYSQRICNTRRDAEIFCWAEMRERGMGP